jgi:SHS2 domain-containing protein
MPYKFREDIAIADVAFEAWDETVEGLFTSAAEALMKVQVENLDAVENRESRAILAEEESIEMLLFAFLQELIFMKDAYQLILRVPSVKIRKENENYHLNAEAYGEEIDPIRHELNVDVKAVTLHHFRVEQTSLGWRSLVILDV